MPHRLAPASLRLCLAALVLLAACSPAAAPPAPTPPAVELVKPAPGSDDVQVFGPIAVRAAPGSDHAAVERSFAIEPPARGTFEWQGDLLLFRPDWPGLAPGTAYEVRVGGDRQRLRFTTAGRLAVSSVVPEPNATGVLFDTPIFVQFNRPVVPLTTLDQPPSLVPLRIEPAVEGSGHWLNTSLYTFTPKAEQGWAPATTYHVVVPTTVADVLGGTLTAEFAWSFNTQPPAVATTQPAPRARLVDPSAPARITFNQPVDPAAVQVSVTRAGAPAVAGQVEWTDRRTLLFHPASSLEAGVELEARVEIAGATASYVWRFSTAPPPAVVRSIPAEGAEAPRLGQVELFFSSPMDRDQVREKLTIQPEPDSPPFFNWSDDDTHLTLAGGLNRPSTGYVVSLPAGVLDRFGRALSAGLRLSFTTPAQEVSSSAPPVRPQAWVMTPLANVGTYDAYETPRALVRTINVTSLTYSLERLDLDTVVKALSPSGQANVTGRPVRTGSVDISAGRNVPRVTTIDLAPLAPGYYHLRVQPHEADAGVQDRVLVVTRTMLSVKETDSQLLAWAVDLRSGEVLPNLPVRVLRSGGVVAQGVTNANGVAQFDLPRAASAERPGVPPATFVVADRAGDVSLATSTWSGNLQSPWASNLPVAWYTTPWAGHLYTDRPVYRPGQTVHLKGILRADDDAHFSPPPAGLSPAWRAIDSQGRVIAAGTASLSGDLGTFSLDIDLSPEAATGDYTVQLTLDSQHPPSRAEQEWDGVYPPTPIALARFQVAEYRRPEFEVNLAPSAEALVSGQALSASLHTAYYFGLPLAGAAVHWRVSSEPFSFRWPEDPVFRFGDADQALARPGAAPSPPSGAQRTEGKGTTDANGALTFQIPTALAHDASNRSSQRFTVEATVTDPNQAEVSQRTAVVVHQAGLYLGLKPSSFVGQAGRPLAAELVAVDVTGKPQPAVSVHAQVFRRKWLSVRERDSDGELRWRSRPEDTLVSTQDVRTGGQGRSPVSFVPADGGEYRIVVEAPDASGNVAHTALSTWVAGPGFVPWRLDDERLALQADKPEYQPGDVARVIVPAPVADALALISIERGKLISHQVRRLSGNSAVLEIPIGAEHVPNAYVSVLLFKGGQAPAVRVGYLELAVSSAERRLQVSVEPDRRHLQPRDTVSFTIHTRDAAGRGTPAEVSLALVDAAVLALADGRSGDPLLAFWHQRPLGVRTGTSQALSIDRLNEAVSSGRKGGGGGEQVTVRQEFPDTAYWQPSLRTDAAGEARVSIALPDTLTTWRLTAVAVTADTRLGTATADIVTSKPLLVQPIVPRFLVAGDAASLGATLHNTTDRPLQVSVSLQATGLSLQGEATHMVGLPAGGQARVDWPLASAVDQAGQATLRFEATAAEIADAVEVRLPVLTGGAASTVATAGEVAPADTATESIDVPAYVDRHRGELSVEVAPSLAAALRYSLAQVEEYPYACLEQTVSRFLPRLALERAIDGLGLGDPLGLKDQLPGLVTRSIQRIYRDQHPDGGWGWWRDDVSQPYLTAYALFGLLEARQAGLAAVDQGVLDRGREFLRGWLNADPGAFGLDTRAYVLYVLGQLGAPEPNRAAALFDRRADLGPTAKAYLAQTLAAIDPHDGRVGGLLAELSGAAVVSATGAHWESPRPDDWAMDTSVRTTAGVLDALVRLRPDQPLVTSAVRWLMAARRDGGGWESTHDTAQSLLALTDYLAASGELKGVFDWQVALNGQTRASGSVGDAASRVATQQLHVPMPELQVGGANRLDLARGDGPGRLYYTVQLRSYAPADELPAESRGFSVAREYVPASAGPSAQPVSQARVGDLLLVKVTVLAPSDLHHVIIEDPLPAGLEPVDTNLKTTSLAARDALAQARAQRPKGAAAPVDAWRWRGWDHIDVRDQKVALFASYLPKGTYQYVYLARASLAGAFHALPTNGYEQYFPEVLARADGRRFTVVP